MEQILDPGIDRVRKYASPDFTNEIDQKTRDNILWYSREEPDVIAARMAELDQEWDIERILSLNAALLSLAGIIFGATRNKLWFLLPVVANFFLGQHAVQGWAPPIELLRRSGIRTRKEIDMEKYALLEALKSRTV